MCGRVKRGEERGEVWELWARPLLPPGSHPGLQALRLRQSPEGRGRAGARDLSKYSSAVEGAREGAGRGAGGLGGG